MNSARKQAQMAARRERWARIVSETEASGLSLRAYCRQHEVRESHFYHWRRILEAEGRKSASKAPERAFVLVKAPERSGRGSEGAALELVLERGWRLRIPRGVDEATLQTVLGALGARV